jgi:hypothetical protein
VERARFRVVPHALNVAFRLLVEGPNRVGTHDTQPRKRVANVGLPAGVLLRSLGVVERQADDALTAADELHVLICAFAGEDLLLDVPVDNQDPPNDL